MRLKRVTPGSFLSGPARRGFRRQSEEEAVAQGEGSPVSIKEPVRAVLRQLASTPGSQHRKLDFSNHALQEKENNPLGENKPFGVSANVRRALQFSDENVDIDAVISSVRAGEKASEFSDAKIDMAKILADVRRAAAEKEAAEKAAAERAAAEKAAAERAAAERASPPPKMTVVETATAAAGASAAAQAMKKKQILLRVNNRAYAKIDCIGRGGSGKVYRVSAESGKMLALKRVPLELADERTVENYKGEIDLLKRLQGVDRVIQLIDYELNIDKKVLSMVMEIGELDFQTFLRSRQGSPEGERMDPVFVRNWWKEMVECVRAVHQKDIVHSDLKPANFVIVQGRLKLIDFGIANALQTDMTVNVHREHQIGTPNYMSPESLLDSHMYSLLAENHGNLAAALPQAQDHIKNRGRLMKLGKPSDVWSLGCILYQMVYGHPPFGKIKSQPARCQAIISWAHEIDFSEKTEHGVRVPPSLIRTMRRCLNREQKERPTCDELLAETDPFLYPREFDAGVYAGAEQSLVLPVTEEVLGQIIQSVVRRCKAKMPSMEEVESVWGKAYFSALKNMH
jgi:serine/threonine-protein kinase TTK/MPS1